MFLTHDYKEDKNKNTNRDTSKTEEKAKHKFKEPERKSGEMSHEDTGTEGTEAKNTEAEMSTPGSQEVKKECECLEHILLLLAYLSVLVRAQ